MYRHYQQRTSLLSPSHPRGSLLRIITSSGQSQKLQQQRFHHSIFGQKSEQQQLQLHDQVKILIDFYMPWPIICISVLLGSVGHSYLEVQDALNI